MTLIEIHGHRGARARYPENTFASFQHALEAGVDYIEFDVGVSRDFVPVITHDARINTRICTVSKDSMAQGTRVFVKDLSLEEIKGYDCGLSPQKRFPKQMLLPSPIPSLAEFFTWIANNPHPHAKKVQFNIDTKVFPNRPEQTHPYRVYSDCILKIVEEYDMIERSMLQSFDFRVLKYARKQMPELRRSALTEGEFRRGVEIMKECGAEKICTYWARVSRKGVDAIHAAGGKVLVYTPNEIRHWEEMIRKGVDGIITDDPQTLIDWLKGNKNLLSSANRYQDL